MYTTPVYKKPLIESKTVSVPISGTASVVIEIPYGKRFYIKKINITKGADTTIEVNGVIIDGTPTKQGVSFDVTSVFGDLLTSSRKIEITGSNASTTVAQDLKLEIIGFTL